MSDPNVLIERDYSGYAVITLNRPQAMNAMSRALLAELTEAIEALTDDPDVRVLILTGSGRAFCAGLDLKELGSGEAQLGRGGEPVSLTDPAAWKSTSRCTRMLKATSFSRSRDARSGCS